VQNKKDINPHNTVPKLDLHVSLVPGYGDDSDGEEEVRSKQEIKPLFPIAQNEECINVTNSLKNIRDALTKNSGNIQTSECSDSNEDTEEMKNHEKTEEKKSKTDEDKSKTNIFLEDIQVCGKAFQRKKRIAFDGINYVLSNFIPMIIYL